MRNTGADLPELSLSEPPLGACPYFWAEVTEAGHEDQTREVSAKPRKKKGKRSGGGRRGGGEGGGGRAYAVYIGGQRVA